jgi:hypothetical protein
MSDDALARVPKEPLPLNLFRCPTTMGIDAPALQVVPDRALGGSDRSGGVDIDGVDREEREEREERDDTAGDGATLPGSGGGNATATGAIALVGGSACSSSRPNTAGGACVAPKLASCSAGGDAGDGVADAVVDESTSGVHSGVDDSIDGVRALGGEHSGDVAVHGAVASTVVTTGAAAEWLV